MTVSTPDPAIRPDQPPAVYTARDLAGLLRCSIRHVWRMRDCGHMPPPIRVGRLVRWEVVRINDWIRQGCPSVRKGVRS
jgi:predicted DNA-binding transcriptional regulator AlpA